MIVTLNEVQRICQKALAGAGAPPGVDDDGASAAVWLEPRGLPALPTFLAALERWDGDPDAATGAMAVRDAPQAMDARGRSAVFLGSGLMEVAVALAARGEAARLEIAALTDPQFLVPAAESLSGAASFAILWGRAGQGARAGAAIDGEAGTTLLGDWTAAPGTALDVTVLCHADPDASFDTGLALAQTSEDLSARRAATLASGLSVEDRLWAEIGLYARRTLVPASAESRARGAGSAASDNE